MFMTEDESLNPTQRLNIWWNKYIIKKKKEDHEVVKESK